MDIEIGGGVIGVLVVVVLVLFCAYLVRRL
jgi:hypothetical protein